MPSLSPPPTNRIQTQPSLAAPLASTATSHHTLTSRSSNPNLKESDADARLRDRGNSPSGPAFGGRRRIGRVDLGLRRREWIILGVVTLLGSFVRLHKLSWPTSVV